MSNAPRFENQQIVNSFNLFIDSERASIQGDTQSRGDDVYLQFEGNSVEANDGEVIKLTLKEFSMINTMNMINFNNSRALVKGISTFRPITYPVAPATPKYGVLGTYDVITRGNYGDVWSVAQSFAAKMTKILNLFVNPATVPGPPSVPGRAFKATVFGPIADKKYLVGAVASGGLSTGTVGYPQYKEYPDKPPFGGTDDRLLHIQFDCTEIALGTVDDPAGGLVAHGITDLKIQMAPSEGDTHTILGGLRMDGPVDNDIFNSLMVDYSTNANIVTMKGYFPMFRYSEPSIYLRTNVGTNGLEMSVLQANAVQGGNALIADIITSDIIAKINMFGPQGPSELISYNAQSDEYFVNIQQRKLTSLRLFLTDSKGRRLGRFTPDNDNSGTAAGRETEPAHVITPDDGGVPSMQSIRQNEIGNLYFTAVLKVDVVKASCPNQLETEVFPPPYPGSKSGGILPFTSFGQRSLIKK
jgi:hypothetical protein